MSQQDPNSSPPSEGPILRFIGMISTVCGVTAALMIFVSVLITCEMIFVRFVLGESTLWQTEAVTYLMIAATMIGLPYVQRLHGHVNVDLVPMLLPRRLRNLLAQFTLLLTMAVIGVMAFYGYELFHMALERNWKSETIWGVPLWIPYLAMPVGFGLFLLQLAADFFAVTAGKEDLFEHGDFEEDY